MSKELYIVAVEGNVVRAVKMAADGKVPPDSDRALWTRRFAIAPADENAPGAGEAVVEDDAIAGTDEEYVDFLTRAFDGVVKKFHTREIVLGVGLSRVLSSLIRVPVEDQDLLPDKAADVLVAQNPFQSDDFEIGLELQSETASSIRSMAFALPESSVTEITEALENASLRVVRTDVTAIGWLKTIQDLGHEPEASGMEVMLVNSGDGWDMLILEDGHVSFSRGMGELDSAALKRELMLTLVRNAPYGVAKLCAYTLSPVPEDEAEVLADFGFATEMLPDPFGGVIGIGKIAAENDSEYISPDIWRDALKESRFKKRMSTILAVAGAIWLAVLGVLVGVPKYYDYRTAQVKAESKAHRAAHKAVSDTRERALLVKRYSNRDTSALEMLRIVSENMPYGVNLSRFQYTKDEKLVVSGDAEDAQKVYDFKNNISAIRYTPATDDDAGDAEDVLMFPVVDMKGPTLRRGKQQFTLEALFKAKEED